MIEPGRSATFGKWLPVIVGAPRRAVRLGQERRHADLPLAATFNSRARLSRDRYRLRWARLATPLFRRRRMQLRCLAVLEIANHQPAGLRRPASAMRKHRNVQPEGGIERVSFSDDAMDVASRSRRRCGCRNSSIPANVSRHALPFSIRASSRSARATAAHTDCMIRRTDVSLSPPGEQARLRARISCGVTKAIGFSSRVAGRCLRHREMFVCRLRVRGQVVAIGTVKHVHGLLASRRCRYGRGRACGRRRSPARNPRCGHHRRAHYRQRRRRACALAALAVGDERDPG